MRNDFPIPEITAREPRPPQLTTLNNNSAMRTLQLLSLVSAGLLFSTSAQAQFSVSSPTDTSFVPAAGSGGGTFPTGSPGGEGAMPAEPGVSTMTVNQEVGQIVSIEIHNLLHTWGGDLQVTITDPNLVEHNVFLRPGYNNPAGNSFGTPGNFTGGTYTFVVTGGSVLPTLANGASIPSGTYNQTFDTGGYVWNSGDHGIMNTSFSNMGALAGDWTLKVYDWGIGDDGSFEGWTMNALEPGVTLEPGTAYCFGDGTGTACPCGNNGAPGFGCANSSGGGARMTAAGDAVLSADTMTLDITGVNGAKAGLLIRGDNQVNGGLGNPVGDGLICAGGAVQRSHVQVTDATGATTFSDWNGSGLGSVANAGAPTNYQFWYRDPQGSPCGNGFNFTNAYSVTYQP